MVERMGAGVGKQEVPPGYAEAVAEFKKLHSKDQRVVMDNLARVRNNFLEAKKGRRLQAIEEMFVVGEGTIPPEVSISDEEDKGYFVIAVNKVLHDKAEAARAEAKRQYREPMPHEDIDAGYK